METYEISLEDLLGEDKDTKTSVWDRPVPIRKVGKVYHCYISSAIEEPDNYDELCFVLENLSKDDTAYLHINTYGGHIDSAFKVIASINRSQAMVVARLSGTVASAGTIIALSCDNIEVEDYTHFMIHNYSTGTQGKGHEIMEYVNFNDKDLKKTFNAIYSGFLSAREINEVLKGKDLWLSADDVRKRWEKVV